MHSVFVAGSRALSKLNAEVKERLDHILLTGIGRIRRGLPGPMGCISVFPNARPVAIAASAVTEQQYSLHARIGGPAEFQDPLPKPLPESTALSLPCATVRLVPASGILSSIACSVSSAWVGRPPAPISTADDELPWGEGNRSRTLPARAKRSSLRAMIAPIKSRIPVAGRGSIYHLKITLADVKPPIWQRLRVPGGANLGWLHAVIQVVMGWTNSHLHQFTSGGTVYSDPGFDLDEFEDDPKIFDECQATLQKIAPKLKSELVYEYDFGDSWVHFITVEKIMPPDPAVAPGAECLDGRRLSAGGLRRRVRLRGPAQNPARPGT